MKNKLFMFLCFLLVFFMAGCQSNNSYNDGLYSRKTGEISEFSLQAPLNGSDSTDVPIFTWEEANNAEFYVFELCSSTSFTLADNQVYIKESGLVSASYKISSSLKYKETMYYWRVCAKNSTNQKMCKDNYGSFYLKASNDREINFDINYADEWELHELGSKANISIDKNNFFGNNKNSLVIKFNEEDTNQGIPESDGWIVVSHNKEIEMYGVDSFFFNFYYSGQDSRVLFRVVDEDDEYYYAPIKLANNVKQSIIIKFDDFVLRTQGGTTIANQVFDYNNIKRIELVFEQTFGDGICIVSNIKAVNYVDYSNFFIKDINFNNIDSNSIIFENYNFDISYINDNKDIKLSFANDINGYGFSKIPINKYLLSYDALKIKINYKGSKSANILIRLIEEDKDRWVYKQSCSSIPDDGIIIIPYNAFTLSEFHGDGARQFYYLNQLQLGIEGIYSEGSISFEDITFVSLSDEIDDLFVSSINEDGMIENFEKYNTSAEIYYKWQLSDTNKDEAMILNKDMALGANNHCAQISYKSDMGPAYYGLQLANSIENKNALSFWADDHSVKLDDAKFNHIDTVTAKAIISLYVESGEEYTYIIPSLNAYWTNYTISFSDFTLSGLPSVDSMALESKNIRGVKFGFQYYYYLNDGTSYPIYSNNNHIYLDNIYLINANETSQKELANKIEADPTNASICYIDRFENYTDSSVNDSWSSNELLSYSSLELIEENNNHFMKMQYKGNEASVSYSFKTLFAESASGKAMCFNLKGDGKATVYINIYLTYANTNYKFRATITDVSNIWEAYTIGFSNFTQIEGVGTFTLANKYVQNITKISIGIVNYKDNELSNIYIDDIHLDSSVSYSTNKKEVLGG